MNLMPESDYIARSDLIMRIRYYLTHTPEDRGEYYAYSVALKEIQDAPAADVAPVVHGRWLHSGCEECSGLEVVKCSECNHEAFAIAFYVCNGNYCPSCGARMDGGVDNGRNDT